MNNTIIGIISFFLPGIGQIIRGKFKKGIIMFIIYIISWLLFIIPGMGILRLIYMIFSAIDASKIKENQVN